MIAGIVLAAAAAPAAPPPAADAAAVVRALHAADERVARVGYALATTGAALCPRTGPQAGLLLQTLDQYGHDYRAAAAGLLGLTLLPTVAVVVPGSPAAAAGLQPGDELLAVGDARFDAARAASRGASYGAAEAALDTLDRAAAAGTVALSVRRAGAVRAVTLVPRTGCPARYSIGPARRRLNATSDGRDIVISYELVALTRTDGELAAPLAHELGHVALDHETRRRQPGFSVRAGEVAADRLSAYFLALAGYPPGDAQAFWQAFGARTDLGIFGNPSHPRAGARARSIAAETARIAALRAQGAPIAPPADLR